MSKVRSKNLNPDFMENSVLKTLNIMNKVGFIYIVTNKWRTTLYTGVTSDLVQRVWRHRNKYYPKSFSAKYNTTYLIYYEVIDSIEDAIKREKYIKGKSRKFKENLINSINPCWVDLYEEFKKVYYGDEI